MILADTSAWVEYDRATGSPTDERLTDLIRGGGEGLAVTEPVLMELLAGARTDEQSNDLRRLLTSFEWITADVVADFEGAALLYRRCRSAGVTPRGLVDCMIATIALRTGAEILALDGDFNAIAEIVPLRLSRSD
jgi:predicted nucleic acid-binding protein